MLPAPGKAEVAFYLPEQKPEHATYKVGLFVDAANGMSSSVYDLGVALDLSVVADRPSAADGVPEITSVEFKIR
jgi:hypothetical protein